METPLFQHQALSEPSQIRLLTILPGERKAAMILELEHADLESDLTYECLSYAWGADDHDRPITLNNFVFLVSATLHIALEHLRYASQARKIWVDAISINQADIAERSHQVTMMKKIYENAMRVNVWLGPATESSEQAMAFLKMMAATRKIDGRNHYTNDRNVYSISETDSREEGNCGQYFTNEWESYWQALDALLARPWWERTWVVQEVWSTSNAVLQCGTTTVEWKTFQRAMKYSETWDDMWGNVKGTKREMQWETLRRRYTLAIHLAKARVDDNTLASLLVNTWDRASTDPRDKVFAMLALLGKTQDVSMAPDYGKSMEQVYREVAHDIITKQSKMDILLAASGVNGRNGLPSWVPDWRCEANAEKPTLLVNRHLMLKVYFPGSMKPGVLQGHGYRASGNSKAFALFSDTLDVLTVLGKRCDKLTEICEADITKLGDTEFTDQAFDFILQSKFVSTNTRSREESERQSTTDLSDTSTLLTTLTGGGNVRNDKRAQTIRNTMRRRQLFVTQHGHLGIGPVDAQPNDAVFIISGCNFPIVLRPKEDKFAVVGEAYSEYLW
jgi:hypothetical protein